VDPEPPAGGLVITTLGRLPSDDDLFRLSAGITISTRARAS